MACVVEIRDQELYVMKALKSKGKMGVHRAFRIYLAEPLFKDREVVITDTVVDQIKRSFETHNIRDSKVKLVINHRVALTKDLTVPKTDKKKMAFLVENEMINLFNLTKDFIVDYTILNEVETEGVTQVKALSCALRKSTIAGLEDLFSAVGKRIDTIDVAPVSFMNFLYKTDIIDTFEPVIVIDASSSYIRYYLFYEKKFVLMRTLYIHVEDDHSVISKRVLHVLELMSQSQLSITGKPVEKVKLLGFNKRFNMMSALSETYLRMSATVPNIFNHVSPEDNELFDFGNTLGVIL